MGTDIHAVPVRFIHGGSAILGGSVVGEVELWDATSLRTHCRLLLRRTLLLKIIYGD